MFGQASRWQTDKKHQDCCESNRLYSLETFQPSVLFPFIDCATSIIGSDNNDIFIHKEHFVYLPFSLVHLIRVVNRVVQSGHNVYNN